jgi:hypothetical protein
MRKWNFVNKPKMEEVEWREDRERGHTIRFEPVGGMTQFVMRIIFISNSRDR